MYDSQHSLLVFHYFYFALCTEAMTHLQFCISFKGEV